MPGIINDLLFDAQIDHAVALHKYSNGIVRRVLAMLKKTEPDLAAALAKALETLSPGSYTVERLESMLASVKAINKAAYDAIGTALIETAQETAQYEAGYQLDLYKSIIPEVVQVKFAIASVSTEQTYAAALARPFQGVLMREWAGRMEAGAMQRIRDEVRIGFVANEPTETILRRVRGTRAMGYADGVQGIARRNLETVTRSAIGHTAAFVRDRFNDANSDLIKAVKWSATLDNRTSIPCRLRDGKLYSNDDKHKPIGHKYPYGAGPGRFHYNCRSCATPITKSYRELGIDLDEVPPGERASMDGAVPAETTFGDWIRKQSTERQEEVLGVKRAALMRAGVTLDKFANDKGEWFTLDELYARDAAMRAAFKKSNVSP